MRKDIIYSDDVLMINLEGKILKSDYNKLKRKMNYIINEYQINDVVLDIRKSNISELYLDDLENSINNLIIKR